MGELNEGGQKVHILVVSTGHVMDNMVTVANAAVRHT